MSEVDRIAAMIKRGQTFRLIAAELGLTRNQVAGIAYRHGLKRPASAVRKLAPVSSRYRDGGCRWIEGDPKPVPQWCGEKRRAGSSYCQAHHQRCYRPAGAAA